MKPPHPMLARIEHELSLAVQYLTVKYFALQRIAMLWRWLEGRWINGNK